MWPLYRTAKATNSRPSDLLCVEDRLAAYLFDSAVVTFGTIIENAAQELEKRGTEKEPRWEAKYTMRQLLDPDFRLPSKSAEQAIDEDVDGMIYDEVG